MCADASSHACPHLGWDEDPSTYLAFPSVANVCRVDEPQVTIGFSLQSSRCLTADWADCPRYKAVESGDVPPEERGAGPAQRGKGRRPSRWVVAAMAVIAVELIVVLILVQPWKAWTGAAEPTGQTSVPTATAPLDKPPGQASQGSTLDPTKVVVAPTLTASATDTPSPTPSARSTEVARATPSRTASPTRTATLRPSPSATSSPTETPRVVETASPTPSAAPSPSATASPTLPAAASATEPAGGTPAASPTVQVGPWTVVHVVQADETLGRIAAGYGVTVESIAGATGLEDVNLINPGQVLTVPLASADAALEAIPVLTGSEESPGAPPDFTLPPPVRLTPGEGETVGGSVPLSWQWDRELEAGQYYAVLVRWSEQLSPCCLLYATEPALSLRLDGYSPDVYSWTVRVVEGAEDGSQRILVRFLTPPSGRSSFTWTGAE